MDYLKLLEESFGKEDYEDYSRLEFLAEEVFGFTTYENHISPFMADKALQVCEAITDSTTFDYINTKEGNLWYLVMVNMPFFEDKIEWGCSIRGAWWDLYGKKTFAISSCGLFYEGEQVLLLQLDKDQWKELIKAMLTFAY